MYRSLLEYEITDDLEFKTNVKTITEIQSLTAEARIKMIEDYASKGKSIKELVIETKKDGKTYFDNTNKSELEKVYQEKVTLEYFDNKCLDYGINLEDYKIDNGDAKLYFIVETKCDKKEQDLSDVEKTKIK